MIRRHVRPLASTLVAVGLSACGHAVLGLLYLVGSVPRSVPGDRPTTPARRRAPRDVGAGTLSMGLGRGPRQD